MLHDNAADCSLWLRWRTCLLSDIVFTGLNTSFPPLCKTTYFFVITLLFVGVPDTNNMVFWVRHPVTTRYKAVTYEYIKKVITEASLVAKTFKNHKFGEKSKGYRLVTDCFFFNIAVGMRSLHINDRRQTDTIFTVLINIDLQLCVQCTF